MAVEPPEGCRAPQRRAGLVAGLALLAGCGTAASQCEVFDPHFYQPPPTDLGNGMVTRLGSPVTYSASSWATESREVVDCASGERVSVIYFQFNSFDPEAGVIDVRDTPAVDEFEALFSERGRFRDIAVLKARAQAAGLRVETESRDEEDCGCSVFYPWLRGDKEAYGERA